MSAVVPAIQLYMTDAIMTSDWREGACMWDVFCFNMRMLGEKKWQFLKNYAKLVLKGFQKSKSHPSQGRRKLVST